MNSKIKKIFVNAIRNRDINIVIQKLSLEERKYIFSNIQNFTEILPFNNYNYTEEELLYFASNILTMKEKEEIYKTDFDNYSIDSKYLFLLTFSDEIKFQNMDTFNNNGSILDILLTSVSNDNLKIDNKYYDSLSWWQKARVARSIKDDKLKIKVIETTEMTQENIDFFMKIINSLSDDNLKMELINKELSLEPTFHFDDSKIASIVSTLSSDKLKLEYYDNFMAILDKSKIVASLESDELKLKLSENWNTQQQLAFSKVILSLSNDELKIEQLEKFSSVWYVADVINSLNSDESKIKAMSMQKPNMNIYGSIDFTIMRTHTVNEELTNKLSEMFNINASHLAVILQKYGYSFLDEFNQKTNLLDLLNLNDEEFNKFIKMFDAQKTLNLSMENVDNICGSLAQREFRLKYPEILSVFSNMKNLATNKNKIELVKQLEILKEYVDVEAILKNYEIDMDTFIEDIVNEKTQNFTILHEITNNYINLKRDEYARVRTEEMKKGLAFDKIYEKNYLLGKVTELDENEIYELLNRINVEKLSFSEANFLQNKELLNDCIAFKKNPKLFQNSNEILKVKEVQKKLKIFTNILEVLYRNGELNYLGERDLGAKVIYNVPPIDEYSLLEIISNVNFKLVSEKLLNDEQLYKKLMQVLSTQRILGWGDEFDSLLESADLIIDSETVASLVTYFYKFYPELEKKLENGIINNISLGVLLDEVNIYGSSSGKYKTLLGDNTFKLISTNPGPNAAHSTKTDRLSQTPELIRKMYNREFISVPPMDEIINISKDKNLRVSIGNFTDTQNLVLGESTGSCSRIDGIGRSLFDYCISGENGFNVRIMDPETNELISKVNGFRNGNMLAFNELRYSTNSKKYSNEDLVKMIKDVATKMIERTANSEMPIDNVLIVKAFSMGEEQEGLLDNFNVDLKSGLDDEDFYTDFHNDNTILLASRSADKSLKAPILSNEKVPKYKTFRKGIEYIESGIENKMMQIKLIDQLLNGVAFENTQLQKGAEQGIALYSGEDWYILLDEESNIIDEYKANRPGHIILQNSEILSVKAIIEQKGIAR